MNTWFSISRRPWLAGAAAAAIVTTATPVLWAQTTGVEAPRGARMARMGAGPFGGLRLAFRELGLTEAQRTQVRTIFQSHRTEFQAIAERARAARQKLHGAAAGDEANEEAIRSASSELAEVQADGAILRAKVHQEVFATLTPEQQAKATQLRAEREQRMDQRRQRFQERLTQRRQVQPQGDLQ